VLSDGALNENPAKKKGVMSRLPKEHEITIAEGERIFVRPVRLEDEPRLVEMLAKATPDDVRFRCFGAVKDFPHWLASRLVHTDLKRETTLVAVAAHEEPSVIMGVVHIIRERNEPNTAEFDIMVRSDHKGHGVGYLLMTEILQHARECGLAAVEGYILSDNRAMLLMAGELGFKRVYTEGDTVCVRAELSGTIAPDLKTMDTRPQPPAGYPLGD
jgi:acetyltransferase